MQTEIYTNGPIVCTLANTEALRMYTSGVLNDKSGVTKWNASVSVTGWGVDEQGVKYWQCRQSYVCVCVCVRVCVCVCVCVCVLYLCVLLLYTCIYQTISHWVSMWFINMCVCVCVVCVYVPYMYVCVCVCTHAYRCMYVCMCVCVHVCLCSDGEAVGERMDGSALCEAQTILA